MIRSLAVLVLVGGTAAAADRPPVTPLRDVDVVYAVPHAGDGPPLAQRMRWSVSAGRLRVDPPAPGFYMIVDYRAKQMSVVKPAAKAVLDMPGAGPGLPGAAAGSYTARDKAEIAGLACTQWQTADAAGAETLLCLTDDGVMLQASQGGHVMLQAVSVTYGPQDPAAFIAPDGYTHVAGQMAAP